jgi:hypothetical protein
LLDANADAWELTADGSWHRRRPAPDEDTRTAQTTLIGRARGPRRVRALG